VTKPAFDPFDPKMFADPFPAYAALREEGGVPYCKGIISPYFVALRYDDVREVAVNSERYTARYGTGPIYMDPGALCEDGPEHVAFRMMVQARFAPKSMQRLQEPLTGFVANLIDDMVAGGARGADFNQALALPLPVKTTQHLLGGYDVNYRELARLADRSMYHSRYGGDPDVIARMRWRIAEVFDKWIDDREALLREAGIDAPDRSHIGSVLPDDVTSDLLAGRWEGRRLTRAELHKMLIVMLVGGIETTNHLIGNCVWRLLEDRARWEAVLADQDRLIPVAIEESLRFDPPGLGLWRTTLREIEMQGETIPAHTKVQMAYAAANRDPRVFPDPDSFRLDRPMTEMRRHLSFGAGPHTCVGQYLARLEAQLTLKALFERLPSLRLAGETERVENFSFWGRRRLPVGW